MLVLRHCVCASVFCKLSATFEEIYVHCFVKLLSKTLGYEMERGTGGGGQLQGEELHDFCSSSDVIRAIKSRIMRWVGNVACRGENTGATISVVKLQTLVF